MQETSDAKGAAPVFPGLQIAGLSAMQILLTDAEPAEELSAALREAGLQLIIAA